MTRTTSSGRHARATESTNVRPHWSERLLRAGFGRLGPWLPGPSASLAERLFFTAPRVRSPRLEAALSSGRRVDVKRDGLRLATWRWGSGRPVVLLHGWGGRAGQLVSFVEPLVAHGHEVVALDAPGHGLSGGRLSSMVDFALALRAVQEELGAFRGVVAHSLGCAGTAFALGRGLLAERVVFLGPPAGPADWTRMFAARLAVPPRVMDRMRAQAETRLGVRWSDLDVVHMSRSQTVPLLVVHDEHDKEVPHGDGRAIAAAWPQAEFLGTKGLGHRRILRDEGVVGAAVSFLTGRPRAVASTHLNPAQGSADSRLEEDLYFRSRRHDRMGPATIGI